MTGPEDPPADFESLKALLVSRREQLPKRLAQAAQFALAHPDEIAFGTTARIAEAAEVQASTLVRLAQTVGYAGFSELQEVFRRRLRQGWPDYRERVAALKDRVEDEGAGRRLLEGFTDSAMASLKRLRDSLPADQIEAAAGLLAAADTIHLLGLRRAFPVAAYLAYALGKLEIRAALVDHVGALAAEQLASARSEDALVAVSFTPYTQATVELANGAARRGVPVLAITDSPFSPLAPSAKVCFEVVEADFGAFRSLSATFCLAMALAVATAGRRQRG